MRLLLTPLRSSHRPPLPTKSFLFPSIPNLLCLSFLSLSLSSLGATQHSTAFTGDGRSTTQLKDAATASHTCCHQLSPNDNLICWFCNCCPVWVELYRALKKMNAIASDTTTDGQTLPSQWEFSCDLEVDYESEENARIVYSALAVDKELQPDKVKRQMTVSDGKLSVHFEAVEARLLRASFSAFVDVLTLATKTIEDFSQGMEL